MPSTAGRILSTLALCAACWTLSGCAAPHAKHDLTVEQLPPVSPDMPRELSKVVLPTYTIEPPDILTIEAIHAVPRSPYFLRPLDVLNVQAAGVLPEAPIAGVYPVEPGGIVNLGSPYGGISVAGMTAEQARVAIEEHLRMFVTDPQVAVALVELGASQQLIGQFLVAPDGTVTLGSYGSVTVVGKTIAEAKWAIEQHLSQFLDRPVISLNVFAYNSKVYYIVLQGAGLGDGIYRFPITGNETVLDAIAQINGLEQVSSKRIWVARPACHGVPAQILPFDYYAVTELALPQTNYQILPGDRVFIAEDKLVKMDTQITKLISPLERIFGFSLLGAATVTRFSGPVLRGGGNPQGSAGF